MPDLWIEVSCNNAATAAHAEEGSCTGSSSHLHHQWKCTGGKPRNKLSLRHTGLRSVQNRRPLPVTLSPEPSSSEDEIKKPTDGAVSYYNQDESVSGETVKKEMPKHIL